MEAEKNSAICMGLVPGPNKADDICGKTTVMGTMQRGSTVLKLILEKWDGSIWNWTDLAQDRDQWQAVASTVRNLPVPQNVGYAWISFRRRILFHGVGWLVG
jgi:hypothetical protein